MPIYEYRCAHCGVEGEVLQKIDADPPKCCDVSMLKKVTHQAMVLSRGNGLYPSEQKHLRGSAPYSTRSTMAWGDYDPGKYSMNGTLLDPTGRDYTGLAH